MISEYRFVFDQFPGPDGATLIEIENKKGKSVNVGRWQRRGDGYVELVFSWDGMYVWVAAIVFFFGTAFGALLSAIW